MAPITKLAGTGVILLLLFGSLEGTETSNVLSDGSNAVTSVKKHTTVVDLLLDELLEQEWGEEEKQCYGQILHILKNVQNSTLWATWIWDSIQLPMGQFYGSKNHFGNFDQCLRKVWTNGDPVPTQYCNIDIKLSDTDKKKTLDNINAYDTTESYFNFKTVFGLTFNVMTWGVCTPAVCSKQSVERFVLTLYKLTHMSNVNDRPDVKIQDCQITKRPPANSTRLYLLMLSALLSVAVAVVCTHVTRRRKNVESNSTVMEIVKAFDLRSNADNLMSVNKDEIKVMHGIRFLSSVMVVTLHMLFVNVMATAGNGLDMNDNYLRYAFILSYASIIVDTFFMMSGLLLVKSFKPETGRLINPVQMMIKRYFRLIWIFVIMIFVTINLAPYFFDGPRWSEYGKVEVEACKKTWWLGVLMLGNYIDTKNMCLQISWYVPADYHLAVFTTFVYWLYQRNRRGGLYLIGSAALMSILVPGLYNYYNKLMAITVFDYETVGNSRELITDLPMYVHSHLRAAPYFVGLAAGFILSFYKPANYRNVISKTNSIICFIAIFTLSTAILLIGARYQLVEYNALDSAVFAATTRALWAALNAAFILLCEYGSLPVLPDFLAWSAFVPLSKLSFGIYMCHYVFATRLLMTARSPATYDTFKVIHDGLGVVVVASILSLFLSLFIESPLNNLVSLMLKTKPKTREQNGDANNRNDSIKEEKEGNGYGAMMNNTITDQISNTLDQATEMNGAIRKRKRSIGQSNIK